MFMATSRCGVCVLGRISFAQFELASMPVRRKTAQTEVCATGSLPRFGVWMPALILSNPHSLKEFVGREIGVSEWLRVSQERIAQFADATEDRQWIHLDGARAAAESPYGTTIAHGFLTLSLLSHFMAGLLQIGRGPP